MSVDNVTPNQGYPLPNSANTLSHDVTRLINALLGVDSDVAARPLSSSSTYVGTTAIALNRASAAQSLTGITSIDGSAAKLTTPVTLWGQSFDGSLSITGALTSVGNITGSGAISLTTAAASNLSLTSGTTGSVTLDSGTTGSINIGTGANTKTITLGSSTGTVQLPTAVTKVGQTSLIQGGAVNITFPTVAGTLVGSGDTGTVTATMLASTTGSGSTVVLSVLPTFGTTGIKLSGSTSGTTTLLASTTASGSLTLPAATDTLIGKATTDTLTNKTFDTAGAGNSFLVNGTTITAVTGTGSTVVLSTSPSLTTPTLGVASATTINKVTLTAPATGSTLTIADGKTLTASNTVTLSGTDSSTISFGAGGTVAYLGTNNAFTGANTFTNATGQVFRQAATQDGIILNGRAGGTSSYSVTLTPTTLTASRTLTLPDVAGTVVTTGDTGTVTSTMILNGTVLDADINASAAIAGTKISPNFGSQNVTTTGTNTAASFIPSSSTVPTNGLYLPSANNVGLATNSTLQFLIDSSGNVGIGVTPSAWGSGFKALEMLGLGIGSNAYGSSYFFQNSYFNGTNFIYTTTAAVSLYQQTAGSHRWYTAPSGTAGNAISFTQAMTLDASGNLGVGNSSPSTYGKLSVVTANGAGNCIIASYGGTSVGDYGLLVLGTGTTAKGSINVDATTNDVRIDTRGNAGAIKFVGNGYTEYMRLDSSGRLGLGTSSPGYLLTVIKNSNDSQPTAQVINSNAGGSAATYFNLASNSAQGAGITLTSTGWGNYGLFKTQSAVLDAGGTSSTYLGLAGQAGILFGVGANPYSEVARFDSSGRLGIGTTSPSQALHVEGNALLNGTTRTLQIGSSGASFLYLSGTSGASEFSHNNNALQLITSQANGITFSTNGGTSQAAKIDSSNRLLVGTIASPAYQLQVSTDSAGKPSSALWTIVSDERIKEDIELADLDLCYEAIKAIPLKRYKWRSEIYTAEQVTDRRKLGWIAQDVETVFPKAVGTHKFKYNQVFEETIIPAVEEELDADGNVIAPAQPERTEQGDLISEDVIEDCRDLNSDQIYAAMYGAVQKLMIKVETLEASNADLLVRVTALEAA